LTFFPVRAPETMQISQYQRPVTEVPVDFRADPDGFFDYVALVTAAGFDPEATPSPVVGALLQPWRSHPEGAAVIAASPGDLERFSVVLLEDAAELQRAA
jgi:hypothetical protein